MGDEGESEGDSDVQNKRVRDTGVRFDRNEENTADGREKEATGEMVPIDAYKIFSSASEIISDCSPRQT